MRRCADRVGRWAHRPESAAARRPEPVRSRPAGPARRTIRRATRAPTRRCPAGPAPPFARAVASASAQSANNSGRQTFSVTSKCGHQAASLKDHTDPRATVSAMPVDSRPAHRSRGGSVQPGQQMQQRGFPGPRRAGQRDPRPRCHRGGHPPHGDDRGGARAESADNPISVCHGRDVLLGQLSEWARICGMIMSAPDRRRGR